MLRSHLLPLAAALSVVLVAAPASAQDDYEGDAPGECTDRADNDRDGKFDCEDEGCANGPDCNQGTVEAGPSASAAAPSAQGTPLSSAPEADQGPDSRAHKKLEDGLRLQRTGGGMMLAGGLMLGGGLGVELGVLLAPGELTDERIALAGVGAGTAITGLVFMVIGAPVHLVGTIKRKSAERHLDVSLSIAPGSVQFNFRF